MQRAVPYIDACSTFTIDHWELYGLKQAWRGLDEHTYQHASFVVRGAYKVGGGQD